MQYHSLIFRYYIIQNRQDRPHSRPSCPPGNYDQQFLWKETASGPGEKSQGLRHMTGGRGGVCAEPHWGSLFLSCHWAC